MIIVECERNSLDFFCIKRRSEEKVDVSKRFVSNIASFRAIAISALLHLWILAQKGTCKLFLTLLTC